MANSFLDYKDQHIRVNDLLLAIVFAIIVRLGGETLSNISAVNPLLEKWKNIIKTGGPGLLEFDLSGYWETVEGNEKFLKLLGAAEKLLVEEDLVISGQRLQEILYGNRFECFDINQSELLDVVAAIRHLARVG